MKQKYLIINDKKNKQFKIQEFAELNKETMSLLCEESLLKWSQPRGEMGLDVPLA